MTEPGRSVSEIAARVVLWGPSGSGKTATLKAVVDGLDPATCGPLLSPTDDTDRTLFMDFLSVKMGAIEGVPLRLHLVALPGADRLSENHQALLRGADGFIFVADSSLPRQSDNLTALDSLRRYLATTGQSHLPILLQLNRRDASDAVAAESMCSQLCPTGGEGDVFETVATTGEGVIEALVAISSRVVMALSAATEESSAP